MIVHDTVCVCVCVCVCGGWGNGSDMQCVEGGGGWGKGSNDRHAVCGFSVVSYMYVPCSSSTGSWLKSRQ